MKSIAFILAMIISLNCIAQELSPKFQWRLQHNTSRIHLNRSDIGIWINGIDSIKDRVLRLKIVSDKFSSNITATFVGYETGNGGLIKVSIKSGNELIGADRKLIIIDEGTNVIIGHILIPIGSDAPVIDGYNTRGQLLMGGASEIIEFKGQNLDGVKELLSHDGKTIIESISPEERAQNTFKANVKAISATFSRTTWYKCKYLEFDAATLTLKEVITTPVEVNIGIQESSTIELVTPNNNLYVTDIVKKGNVLTIPVTRDLEQIIAANYNDMQVLPHPMLGMGSTIKIGNSDNGELRLVFKDAEALSGQRIYFDLATNGATIQKYRIGLNFLPEPKIVSIDNGKGDLKFVINKDLNQYIILNGENLTDVFVTPVREDLFNVDFLSLSTSIKEFKLSLKTGNFSPGTYRFLIKRDNTVLTDFAVLFEEPRVPQPISTLFSIVRNGQSTLPNPDGVTYDITSTSDNIKLVFDPVKLQDGYGTQSLNVEVKYYNPDGSLISSSNVIINGMSAIILRKGGNISEVELDVKKNEKDYIRPWGRTEVVISHTADFYKQQLDLKQTFTQTINFISKHVASLNISLTIPPALMTYGKDEEHRVELLPINVGFGLDLTFRDPKNNFRQRNYRVGAYFAGLNFAGNATDDSESDRTFIKKGDIAFMVLNQIHLRRADTFVRVPLLFGAGFTFPIAGATSRGFITAGVGINFQ
jgi:hypothetical protein